MGARDEGEVALEVREEGCCAGTAQAVAERVVEEPGAAPRNDTLAGCKKGCCASKEDKPVRGKPAAALVAEAPAGCKKGCCGGSSKENEQSPVAAPDAKVTPGFVVTPAVKPVATGCKKACCGRNKDQDKNSVPEKPAAAPAAEAPADCKKACCGRSKDQDKKSVPEKPAAVAEAPAGCKKGCCGGSSKENEQSPVAAPDAKVTPGFVVTPAVKPVATGCKKACCGGNKDQDKNSVPEEPAAVAEAPAGCKKACCGSKNREEVDTKCCEGMLKRLVCNAWCKCRQCLSMGPRGPVTSEFKVNELCCDESAAGVQSWLSSLQGVLSQSFNSKTRTFKVVHDPSAVSCDEIFEGLADKHARVLLDGAKRSAGSGSGITRTVFRVDGMCCQMESATLISALSRLDGVQNVAPNVILGNVAVYHDQSKVSRAELMAATRKTGLGAPEDAAADPEAGPGPEESPIESRVRRFPKPHVLAALVLWLLSLLHYVPGLVNFKYVALGSILLCLPSIAYKAVLRVRECVLDINVLMSLAVIGAVALQDFSEGAAVVTLFSLSDWLESRANQRIREAISSLVRMAPETATLAGADNALGPAGTVVAVETVPVDTRLAVAQGASFPLDGVVVTGNTAADESALTGEARPVPKAPGDTVCAGTLNVGQYVEINTVTRHEDSSMSKMIRLVAESSANKAETQQLIASVVKVYTPLVFVVALAMATIPWAISPDLGRQYSRTALVLLVVACPCALVISTPIAYVCGLARAAQQGIMIKGGTYLEALGHLETLFCDKTGTLTQGTFILNSLTFRPTPPLGRDDALEVLYLAERGSAHPLAAAVANGVAARLDPARLASPTFDIISVETLPGEGICASLEPLPPCPHTSESAARAAAGATASEVGQPPRPTEPFELFVGNPRLAARLGWDAQAPECAASIAEWQAGGQTACWVGLRDAPICVFAVGDTLRPEAPQVIANLRKLGLSLAMITGDNDGAARVVGTTLGIEHVYAGLLPADKVRHIKEGKGVVGMVGDGVNDAPSLAAANVSVSLGCAGSAAAVEAADVALMRDDLRLLEAAVRLGRHTNQKILQNVVFSIVSKIVIVVITFTIFPSLWLAIGFDVGGMLLVTVNSLALLSSGAAVVPEDDEDEDESETNAADAESPEWGSFGPQPAKRDTTVGLK